MTHLVIITEDFQVIDSSLKESISPSKGKLLKLPKAYKYHISTDSKGYLYFFDAQMLKPVTIFHESINQLGHKVINTKLAKLPSEEHFFGQALVINNILWFSGISILPTIGHWFPGESLDFDSFIWSFRKQQFISGPKLSKEIKYKDNLPHCTSTYNRTHYFMLGFDIESEPNSYTNRNFALVEFKSQKVTNYPHLTYSGYFQICFCVIIFSKLQAKM